MLFSRSFTKKKKKYGRREKKGNSLYFQLDFEVILSLSPAEADMNLVNKGKSVPH